MMQVESSVGCQTSIKGGRIGPRYLRGPRKNSEKIPVAPPLRRLVVAPPDRAPDADRREAHAARHPRPRDRARLPPAPPSTRRPPPASRPASRVGRHAHRERQDQRLAARPWLAPNLPTSKSNPPIVAAAPVAPDSCGPPRAPPAALPFPVAQRTSATHRVPSDPPPPYNPAARRHSSHPPPAIVKARNGARRTLRRRPARPLRRRDDAAGDQRVRSQQGERREERARREEGARSRRPSSSRRSR